MKTAIYDFLKELISSRIDDLEQEVADMVISRDTDSKSTAGDKHEVGRAMTQIELENLEAQLHRNRVLLNDLESIELERSDKKIGKGSLVWTGSDIYFVSIGLGAIDVNGEKILVISTRSPIGQLLVGKQVGDSFEFRGKQYSIQQIQ